jgi:hypothetical protein
MRKICNEEYWVGLESMKPEEAPCGKSFDDEYQLTICPHERF